MVHRCPVLKYNTLPSSELEITPQSNPVCSIDDLLARAIASSPNDLLIINDDYQIIYKNHADLIATSKTPADISSVDDLLDNPDDKRIFRHVFQQAITNGRYTREMVLPKKDGTCAHIRLTATLILPKEKETLVSLHISDISQLKRTEEDLLLANEKMHILSDVTRHDILNQLTVIESALDLLDPEIFHDPKTGVCIRSIIEERSEIIEQLIEFTRYYQKIGIKAPFWMLLKSVIEGIISEYKCTVSVECLLPEVEVQADPLLPKVFFNLLDNSVRHGGSVSRIIIRSALEEENMAIFWEDNGVGVPDEEKLSIFERNYGKNTGLGLFLIKEILSLTDISISEVGTAGNGAIFKILIPRERYRILPIPTSTTRGPA